MVIFYDNNLLSNPNTRLILILAYNLLLIYNQNNKKKD